MGNFVVVLLVLIGLTAPAASGAERPSRWRKVWRVSQAMLIAGNAADLASSWGKYELNPMMRTGARFSYGSAALKLGTLGGCLVAQHFVARRHPERIPVMASVNFGIAAVLGVVAQHNTTVPK